MIKDPFHTEETPYDLLKINPDSSHNDVLQALPKFMQNPANLRNLNRAQNAVKKLKDPKERVMIDILYYSFDEIKIGPPENNNNSDLVLDEFFEVSYMNPGEFYSDLKKESFTENIDEIKYHHLSISELKKYDDIDSIKFEISFDK